MTTILYNLLIQPLVIVYDVLFTLLYYMIGHPMLTILALSIVINFIALPLYRKADLIQKEEMKKQAKMKPWLTHIRTHFSGDERFMIQSAYYRIEHYSPLNILKEALPLALQVPFFMAAYRYISTIPLLEGVSFGPIHDLLAPDGLITIDGKSINILPVIMTAINFISGYVYSKEGTIRQKVQIYGIGVVFLVLLYNSPSGLVIYWIMNQVFSLGKNLVYSHEFENKQLLSTFIAILVIPLIVLSMGTGHIEEPVTVFLSECILACCFIRIVVSIISLKNLQLPEWAKPISKMVMVKGSRGIAPRILLTGLSFAVLMGGLIPSSIISSSVAEFFDKTSGQFQSHLLVYPATVYLGLFLVWMPVIIFSRDGRKRNYMAASMWALLIIALVNHFGFDPRVGTLYANLSFDGEMRFAAARVAFNIIVCLCAGIAAFVLFIHKPEAAKKLGVVLSVALCILCVKNYASIRNDVREISSGKVADNDTEATLPLSRDGKNVVVFMLDRAIGGYAPFIFDEKPELAEAFQGFVYYPNTISFGPYTNFGVPGLFGGYEYTPAEMNKRDSELISDKHNEALKVLPVIFSEDGYTVTVCDPPYAGYRTTPDLSIYDGYPEIKAYNLSGKFTSSFDTSMRGNIEENQKHNFVLYGLFRAVPLFMKDYIYAKGAYLTVLPSNNFTSSFLDQYSVLDALPTITSATNHSEGSFLMIQNAATHEPVALTPPDYKVNGYALSEEIHWEREIGGVTMKICDSSDWQHYCVNVAAYQELAEWFDYLRDIGVYDNTRIILVADHGRNLAQFEDMIHPDGLDIEFVWPLFMVKDFGATGPVETRYDFMTNADVPTIALDGVIEDPINPFTGKQISNEQKWSEDLQIVVSDRFLVSQNKGRTIFDTSDGHWWTVHDNIFDMNNWSRLD